MKYIVLALSSLIFSSNANAQFWQQTNGPGGTGIQSVAVNSQGHIFVASNAIMRSTDDGQSWMQIATQIPKDPYAQSTYSLKVKPTGELFLMIGQEYDTLPTSGIWRSIDEGNTWIQVKMGNFFGINIMPADGSLIAFILNAKSFFRSTDNGNTWNNEIPNNNILGITNVWGDKAGRLFLNADFLYRSTDNGQNWSKIVNGISSSILAFGESPNGDLYAGVDDNYSDFKILFKSTDGGRVWTYDSLDISEVFSSHVNQIIISPQGRIVINANTEGGIAISDNNGKNWRTYYSYPAPYPAVSFVINAVSIGGTFYLNHASTLFRSNLDSGSQWNHFDVPIGGVVALIKTPQGNLLAGEWLSSDDGKHWTVISRGITPANAIDSSQNLLTGSSGFIFRSQDGGLTWKQNSLQLTNGSITAIDVRHSGEIFASSSTEGIFRSTDNGVTWDQLIIGMSNQQIFSLAVHQNGDVYAGSQNIIYKSTDVGLTWKQLNTNFPAKAGNVTAMVVSTQGNIIAGIDNVGVFWSTDNGTTWAQKALGLNATKINALVSTPSGKVFAGTDSGIFFLDITPSANWLKFNQGLTATNVLSLCRDQSGRIYAGTDVSGVFSSINTFNIAHPNGSLATPNLISPANGTNVSLGNIQLVWNAVTGANTYQVTISKTSDFSVIYAMSDYLQGTSYSFAVHDTNTTFYWRVQAVGDAGASLYSDNWSFSTPTKAGVSNNSLTTSLGANYPNPFSSSTTIPFTIGERSFITLEVFDALGRNYATLANGNYNAGNYEAKFNADNLSAGMYLLRLRTDKQSFTKTLDIVK